MSSNNDLRQIVENNPVPELFDPEIKERVFTHRSLHPIPAHVKIATEEPRDWERYASAYHLDSISINWTF